MAENSHFHGDWPLLSRTEILADIELGLAAVTNPIITLPVVYVSWNGYPSYYHRMAPKRRKAVTRSRRRRMRLARRRQ